MTAQATPPRTQTVASGFEDVVQRFAGLFDDPGSGGGALAVWWDGEPVVDVWAGTRDRAASLAWHPDTAAMSFSTTKGVTAAVVHRLLDRHVLDLDRPIAAYWPDFGANGKGNITLRHVLTHQAGLHNIADLVADADDLLDDLAMEARVAAATPEPLPGTAPGYHAMTFGWVLSGMLRGATGADLRELFRVELAEPLGTDGLRIGLPADQWDDVADLIATGVDPLRVLDRLSGWTPWSRKAAQALYVDGFSDLIVEDPKRILAAQMGAVTGVFTARALAALYTALGGLPVNGQLLLSEPTTDRLRIVQTRRRDYVMGIPMKWRLGYHQAFMVGRSPRKAFGHYGFGGSGGWVDPVDNLAVGFVTNRLGSASTPIADPRFFRLSKAIADATTRAPRPR